MSYLRKLTGAALVMVTVGLAMPGWSVREVLVTLLAYVAVLILIPTPGGLRND